MDFLDELIATISYPPRPANSFTIQDFIDRAASLGLPEMGYDAARSRLERLAKTGGLRKAQCVVDSRVANVYWKEENSGKVERLEEDSGNHRRLSEIIGDHQES